MADEIIPTEGIRQSQIPAGGLRPIVGGQVSMYGRTPMSPASPSIRYGALRSDNGVYAGRVPFQPVNDSASPVIGAYSPYPTMLFAPRRPDSFAMMMDMMTRMKPNIDYTKMVQDLVKRAAKMPVRRGGGGRGGVGTPPSTVPPPVMPTEPMYAPYGSFPNRWEHPFDATLPPDMYLQGDPTFRERLFRRHPFDATLPPDMYLQGDPTYRERLGLDGRSGRSVRPGSMEEKGQEQAAQGGSSPGLMPSHKPRDSSQQPDVNAGRSQRSSRGSVIVVPNPDGMNPVQKQQPPQTQWTIPPNHKPFNRNKG